jgi:hypothetical protein
MNVDVALAVAVTGALGAGYLFALAYAVVQILRSPDIAELGKALWVGAVLCVPVIAALAWFTAGPRLLTAESVLSRR